MHRVIAGFNVWALLFLLVTLGLGFTRSVWHVPLAVFATLFALFAQCAIFALFMGASKLIKEHVELFDLPRSFIERINKLMIPLFRWATGGSMVLVLAAILGGLDASGDASRSIHVGAGLLATVVLAVAVRFELPHLRGMHDLLREMEDALPERPTPRPPADAPGPTELRGRALVYVGATSLTMVLGYRYIAGLPLPTSLVVIGVFFSVACLGLAGYIRLARGSVS